MQQELLPASHDNHDTAENSIAASPRRQQSWHHPQTDAVLTSSLPPDWKFLRQCSSSDFLNRETSASSATTARLLTASVPNDTEFFYRGIRSHQLEITKRGISRGNYAQLHRKAWLEVSDKYHRYGKNLRLYYKHWESLEHPYRMFFDWLDSKVEAAGSPLPNLKECPRSVLDSDTVVSVYC